MNSIYKNRWDLFIAELESNRWVNGGHSQLHYGNNVRSILGVACEVYMKLTNKGEWTSDKEFKAIPEHSSKDYFRQGLQVDIQNFYGTSLRMRLGDTELQYMSSFVSAVIYIKANYELIKQE